MAQTAATLTSVLKEAWTDDRLQKQYYDENPPLEKIEQVKATMIGKQAQVPIQSGRSGGYVSTGAGGGALNPSDAQKVQQAVYTMVYHWFQVEVETSAINQAGGNNLQSVIGAKDMEIQGAVNDMRKQACRQLVTNGDSIVAQCDTGGASATVSLIASPSGTAYGFDAIQRGWLYPGLPIDIGTTADSDTLATGVPITAVSEVAATPTITTGTSVTTTNGTHFITIANPNSTTAANPELNGLRNIVKATGALGGLNPATAGQEFWQAAKRDTATTAFSLDLVLDLQRAVLQKSGKYHTDVWTGLKQESNFYALLQNQVRFANDTSLAAGNAQKPTWNGMTVDAFPDVLDSDWYCLTLSDLIRVTGSITKPTWASDIEGAGGQFRWGQATTKFSDAVVYPFQIGCKRRNTSAAATGLTA